MMLMNNYVVAMELRSHIETYMSIRNELNILIQYIITMITLLFEVRFNVVYIKKMVFKWSHVLLYNTDCQGPTTFIQSWQLVLLLTITLIFYSTIRAAFMRFGLCSKLIYWKSLCIVAVCFISTLEFSMHCGYLWRQVLLKHFRLVKISYIDDSDVLVHVDQYE